MARRDRFTVAGCLNAVVELQCVPKERERRTAKWHRGADWLELF
jgi:hypothetical protein